MYAWIAEILKVFSPALIILIVQPAGIISPKKKNPNYKNNRDRECFKNYPYLGEGSSIDGRFYFSWSGSTVCWYGS